LLVFKGLSLISALLLAGCQGKPGSRVVSMPNLGTPYEKPINAGCEWRAANVAVFNQESQRLKFRYEYCPRQHIMGFKYRNMTSGGKIVPVREVGLPQSNNAVLKLWEQDKPTPDAFLQNYLVQTGSQQSCELVRMTPHMFKVIDSAYRKWPGFEIIPNEPPDAFFSRIDRYANARNLKFRYATKCAGLGLETLVFNKGLVLSIAPAHVNYAVDYRTVTYINNR